MRFDLVYAMAAIPAIIIALAFHEYGHAAMATKMGDPTPRLQGRLTLNPLAHLDPMGTVFILITVLAGFGIGWGKPVITNPAYYKQYRLGRVLVSIAGPAMNLCLAMLAIGVGYLLYAANTPLGNFGHLFLWVFIVINIVLMIFNLIPIPPLDGGHVLEMMLPWQMQEQFRRMAGIGMLVILALLFFTPFFGMLIGGFMRGLIFLLSLGFGDGFVSYLFLA